MHNLLLNATTQSTVACKHNEDPLEVLENLVSYLIAMKHPADRLIKVMDEDTGLPITMVPLGVATDGVATARKKARSKRASNDNKIKM
jgi:hypothetical protein